MTLHPLRLLTALMLMGLIATPTLAGGEGWTDNYANAKKDAETQGKDMLMDFTGSDWCGWCIKLVDEVFSKDEFKAYAKSNLVLVELDFPRDKSKISDEVKAQNAELKEKFGIRGYPTIILADAQGRPYAQTGYQRGGPEAYIKHLEELKAKRVERDEHMAAAEKAEGIEKAKHLFAAMQVVGDDIALQHYKPVVDEIISLDNDGNAGLAKYYQDLAIAKEQKAELMSILRSVRGDADGAIAKLDDMLSKKDLIKSVRQEALSYKSQIQLNMLKDKPAAKVTLLKAIEVDPDSKMAESLRGALKRFFGDDGV